MSRLALVVGAGVTGLTTALCLARAGFSVQILAARLGTHTVSAVAGALWEWPPAVCGYHHDQTSLMRSKEWCMTSYRMFANLAKSPNTGVAIKRSNFYFSYPIHTNAKEARKLAQLAANVPGFQHDPTLGNRNEINPDFGIVDAYSHPAPVIDTDAYLVWLIRKVRQAGVPIIFGRLEGRLSAQWRDLSARMKFDVIVNCAGLGAQELSGRRMFPLRGALVRVHNDGHGFRRIVEAHCVSHDERYSKQDIVFIVPRNERLLVLGGLAEQDEWDLSITFGRYEPIREMYQRCIDFMPGLSAAALDAAEPIRVGLRPFRPGNVCVEPDPDHPMVHNFGHGGAGYSLSWGCALEVVDLVRDIVGPA